jgi:hypothetical protein
MAEYNRSPKGFADDGLICIEVVAAIFENVPVRFHHRVQNCVLASLAPSARSSISIDGFGHMATAEDHGTLRPTIRWCF